MLEAVNYMHLLRDRLQISAEVVRAAVFKCWTMVLDK